MFRKALYYGTGGILGKNKVRDIVERKEGYTRAAQSVLDEMGNDEIETVYIKRTPLSKLIKGALNALSFGEFNKQFEKLDYDDLYHLRLDVETVNGKRFTVEKNSVITLTRRPKTTPNTQSMLLKVPKGTTVNELLSNTQERMKQDYFPYSSKDNNCQSFVLGILQANNLDTPANTKFVKQNTTSLFTDTFRKFTNTVTDGAAAAENATT